MAMTLTQAELTTAQPKKRDRRRSGNAPRSRVVIYVGRLLLLVVFIGLWEIASRAGWIDVALFGRPSGVVSAMKDYLPSDRAIESAKATGEAVLLSFVIGSLSGTIMGLLLGIYPTFDAIVGPFMAPINSVPRIALVPLFLAWFGLTIQAKVVLAVSIVFFILAENARSAVQSVEPDLMTMARVVGLRQLPVLIKVVLPSAVPTMFAGLRLAFTYSLLGVIASEMIAATNGMGQDIVFFSSAYQINTTFAILVELMIAAMLVNLVFSASERRLLRWQRS